MTYAPPPSGEQAPNGQPESSGTPTNHHYTRDANRFWAKVNTRGECWTWTGYRVKSGYGRFRFRGEARRAHRVAWILVRGDIPRGLYVLHSCDNRACVRPDHLRLGTQLENIREMWGRGRARPRGRDGLTLHADRQGSLSLPQPATALEKLA